MSNSLNSLAPITTTATALSNVVLVTPQTVVGYQPQNGFSTNALVSGSYLNSGLFYSNPSLLFHYEGEQTVVLENDITDHYIEDNTSIQDQISQKPDIVTTHGFIGELNDVAPYGNVILQSLQSKLTAISAYTPQLTVDAEIAYNEAFQAYQIAANAVQASVSSWATVTGGGGESVIGNNGLIKQNQLTQNKQQQMFQQFYGYRAQNILFTVQTPWAIFQNMAILRLRAIQNEETNVITDFEVTFKRLRLAKLITAGTTSQNIQDSPTQQQSAPSIQNSSTPPLSSSTFSDGVLSNIG